MNQMRFFEILLLILLLIVAYMLIGIFPKQSDEDFRLGQIQARSEAHHFLLNYDKRIARDYRDFVYEKVITKKRGQK
jgi:hypothetical protein